MTIQDYLKENHDLILKLRSENKSSVEIGEVLKVHFTNIQAYMRKNKMPSFTKLGESRFCPEVRRKKKYKSKLHPMLTKKWDSHLVL